jgi:hypothetical protein
MTSRSWRRRERLRSRRWRFRRCRSGGWLGQALVKPGYELRTHRGVETSVRTGSQVALDLEEACNRRLSFGVAPGCLVGDGEVDERLAEQSRPVQEAKSRNAQLVDGIDGAARAVGFPPLAKPHLGEVRTRLGEILSRRPRGKSDDEDRREHGRGYGESAHPTAVTAKSLPNPARGRGEVMPRGDRASCFAPFLRHRATPSGSLHTLSVSTQQPVLSLYLPDRRPGKAPTNLTLSFAS